MKKIIRNPNHGLPPHNRLERQIGPLGGEAAPDAAAPAAEPYGRPIPPERCIRDLVSTSLRPADPRAKRIPESYRPEVHEIPVRAYYTPAAALAAGRKYVEPPAPGAAPRSGPADELTGHDYDGIQEYDNPTPGWWHMIFLGTVLFSVAYLAVYHLSPMVPSLAERHARAESAALAVQFAGLNDIPMGEEKLRRIMGQPAWLEMGAATYAGSCALCHAADGSGSVGPNLTDDRYRNLTDLAGIARVVAEGAGNGAMPAHKTLLNENEIALVSAYVASLRGKNLPTPPTVNPDLAGVEIPPFPGPIVE